MQQYPLIWIYSIFLLVIGYIFFRYPEAIGDYTGFVRGFLSVSKKTPGILIKIVGVLMMLMGILLLIGGLFGFFTS